jgi:6-phosphofructokinase 2
MVKIATLTMNPAVDVGYQVDRVYHTNKIRARAQHCDPGGGGINVARVIARLGGTARAYYLAGGATGATLDNLLDLHQLVRLRVPIEGETRISTAVYELETGKEYRFVSPGPLVSSEEWQTCLDLLENVECEYFVASGSLPDGVPSDFYARVSEVCRRRGAVFILDSSGTALQQGLEAGNIFMVTPSLGELEKLVGCRLPAISDVAAAALEIVEKGQAQYVVVTKGKEGALLVQRSGALSLPAIPIDAKSAVGAGDSFLAAMTYALSCGRDPVHAFRYGIAAGAAAVLTPGTGLCQRDDVECLFAQVASA